MGHFVTEEMKEASPSYTIKMVHVRGTLMDLYRGDLVCCFVKQMRPIHFQALDSPGQEH